MIPAYVIALTLAGFSARSTMPPNDVVNLDAQGPGFIARTSRIVQQDVYAQLRKRYDVDQLGQVMGPPSGTGTTPPPVTFAGIPSSGDLEIVITITTPGPVGVALFSWSKDAGQTWVGMGVATEAGVPLPGTGLTAKFPVTIGVNLASYSTDNVYTAATPVPEVVLGWIAAILEPRVWARRGVNPQDPQIAAIQERSAAAYKAIDSAANSQTGLYELPMNVDAGGSGANQTRPLVHSQASPFVWMDQSRARGRREDRYGR